jgi:hypothetical protein
MRVSDHLTKQSPEIRQLYRHVLAAVRAIGPVRLDPQGRASLSRCARARSVSRSTPTGSSSRSGCEAAHPLLRRTEDFGPLGRVHHFTIRRPSGVDRSMRGLLRRA